jgi:hypothetical protein
MSEWQPIEMAPHQTDVIVFDPHWGIGVTMACAEFCDGDVGAVVWHGYDSGGVGQVYPTHWMPLPEPPNGAEAQLSGKISE